MTSTPTVASACLLGGVGGMNGGATPISLARGASEMPRRCSVGTRSRRVKSRSSAGFSARPDDDHALTYLESESGTRLQSLSGSRRR
jgi:hypothetical protein